MKFRLDRDVLADSVAWAARTLPTRPSMPMLAGLLVEAADSGLTHVQLRLRGLRPGRGTGRRRRAGPRRSSPAGCSPTSPAPCRLGPVEISARGQPGGGALRPFARSRCPPCRSRTTPRSRTCRAQPAPIAGAVLAAAVAQVAIAAGRDDTLPDAHRDPASRSTATRSPWPPPTATGWPCREFAWTPGAAGPRHRRPGPGAHPRRHGQGAGRLRDGAPSPSSGTGVGRGPDGVRGRRPAHHDPAARRRVPQVPGAAAGRVRDRRRRSTPPRWSRPSSGWPSSPSATPRCG